MGRQWAASEHITTGRAGASWQSVIKQNYYECRRDDVRKRDRGEDYLNLATFHQRAVELFPGSLCVRAGLKRHKAETLCNTTEVKEVGGGWER